MIPIIAWRNIWRNPTRSLVVIFAIALGIWAALFMTGFATGMVNSYLNNTIENVVSHIQIHNPDFLKDGDIKYVINQPERIEQYLQTQDSIRSYSFRTIANGMITSTQGVRGIKVQGVNPDQEIKVTRLDQRIVDGTYFDAEKKGNQVLLSSRLADKLKIKLRSKVVLTFQDMQGDVVPVAFRVVGLFDTGNNPYDDVNVFVLSEVLNNHIRYAAGENTSPQQQAQDSLSFITHEVAINLIDGTTVNRFAQRLSEKFPNLKVETYRQISPDLELYESQIGFVSIIYLSIIMLALVFGIINTMLMAVLERLKELGMLMAIGMNKVRVFFMIMLETMMLGVIGAPLGILLGYVTILWLGKKGINLSAWSDSLHEYGMADIVYPNVLPEAYLHVAIAVFITALVSSIYPAFKAIRLRPVEAIRKI